MVSGNTEKFVVRLHNIHTSWQFFGSQCPDVGRMSMLVGCHNTLCVPQFSWLRCAAPSGESPVYRSGLICVLIWIFRNFHTNQPYLILESLYLLSFVQIESPVVSGGDAGWSQRRGPGEHAVGNPDVPVWEERKPPVPGKAATGQLKAQGVPKSDCENETWKAEEMRNMRTKAVVRVHSEQCIHFEFVMSVLVCSFFKTNQRPRNHSDGPYLGRHVRTG